MALPTITIVGNLTADAELKFTNSGKAVTNLRVACNERKKNEAGEWVDGESVFLDVTVWKNAEAVSRLTRGSKVLIVGTLRQNDYEKDGVKIKAYRVNADHVAEELRDARGETSGFSPVATGSDDLWAAPAVDEDDRRKYGNGYAF